MSLTTSEWFCSVFVVAAFLLIYIIYIIESSAPPKKRGNVTSCSSEHCVRCQRYDVVVSEALTRFREFKQFYGDSGMKRISAYFDDHEGLFATPLQRPNVVYIPGLRAFPVWDDKDTFSRECKLLERHWLDILFEFQEVYSQLKSDSSSWKENSTEKGQWLVYCLYNQGKKLKNNCAKCPKTCSLIESMSSFMRNNLFGNAMFSVLQPDTVVAEHCGPCNVRIRNHLGLIVPVAGCKMIVGGQSCVWRNGCCLCIDDSFTHSVAYDGSEMGVSGPRVVMIIDMWHPDVTMKERDALNAVFQTSH